MTATCNGNCDGGGGGGGVAAAQLPRKGEMLLEVTSDPRTSPAML
jgi:hypothetical protein